MEASPLETPPGKELGKASHPQLHLEQDQGLKEVNAAGLPTERDRVMEEASLAGLPLEPD